MFHARLVLALVVVAIASSSIHAQSSGSRGVSRGGGTPYLGLPELSREVAEGYITIEGTAEVRLAPDQIRVVMAITADAASAKACRLQTNETLATLKRAWAELDIDDDQVTVDFIAVVPHYEWEIKKQNDREVAAEVKAGYRMQINVHLAVETEAAAQQAIDRALQLGLTDILAVDYGSREIAESRIEARKLAVAAAREKAELLLSALFENRPLPINVQEQTRVVYPESLYESFDASHEQTINYTGRRDLPMIGANRARNTYYRGLVAEADVHADHLPMNPEISVVSTVRLYFGSPAKAADAK